MSRFIAIGAVLLAVGGGATAATSSSSQLAYIGKDPGLRQPALYLVNSDGTGRELITSGVTDHTTFSWSPDGQRLAFTGGREGEEQIFVVNADGSGRQRLTAGADPSWSPGGRFIVFNRDWVFGRQIFRMRADGTGIRRLTRTVQLDEFPTWSPDGRKILFERYFGGHRMVLYTMNPNGSGRLKIAEVRTATWGSGDMTFYYCSCPAWSPDGEKIAYEAVVGSGKPDIYVMNVDGTERTRLTRVLSRDENPDWSPDGTQIAFYSERRGNAQIYLMNADGTRQHRITRDPWYHQAVRWRPGS